MKIKALVVDNNPVLLKAVSTILEQEGCDVFTAENGLTAIEIAKDILPDILFTDLIMPQVSGEQLCKVFRGTDDLKHIFIVILSAVVQEERDRILAEIDYDVCIAKGTLKDLRRHLKEALLQYSKSDKDSTTILGDISSQKNYEPGMGNVAQELLTEQHHLKEILENLSEGIIELNGDGKIVSINPASASFFQMEIADLIGMDIREIDWQTHGDLITKWVQEELVGRGGEVLQIQEEEPLLLNDAILTAYFRPIYKKSSHYGICIFRDITRQAIAERKKSDLDNAIRLVKKMDAMSCMAGGVAHDFNNLLTVLCGNLDMIELDGEPLNREEIESLITNARDTAHVTVELVRKISCFSPFGIIQRENLYIHDFLEDVIDKFLKEHPGLDINLLPYPGKEKVDIDQSQMQTAIENVLINAIESGDDVQITITIDHERIETSLIRARQYVAAGRYVKITISDNGRGIEKDNLLKIFDPYFSTKKRGTLKGMGLGLTIVYSTLRNHGGYSVVESSEGRGTDIILYLPLLKSNNELAGGDETRNHLLLIEDDDQLRAISKIMIEFLGFKVFDAGDHDEALEVLRENVDCVSLAIVNLAGRGKQDGVNLGRLMKKMKPEIKLIVSSGSLLDPVMRDCKEYGFSATLQKPFTMDDLRSVLSFV